MVRVLSDDDVASVLSLPELLPVVAEAFEDQRAGAVERPERPHFPVGTGLGDGASEGALGTGLTMPAYVHGAATYATKLASVHEGNADRGLPTVNAQIALTDAETGVPVAYLAGRRVTNARTGCIGGLALANLAPEPATVAVFGAGTQARWQTRAIAAAAAVESVAVYSPSGSKFDCATALDDELDATVRAAASPGAALEGANAVVTATTSTEPVFETDDLEPGSVVVAVGAYTPETCELDAGTVARASRIYADVPAEAVETGDLAGRRSVDDVRPFADLLEDPRAGEGRDEAGARAEEVVVVASVGSAVLDAATAEWLVDRAREEGVGQTVTL